MDSDAAGVGVGDYYGCGFTVVLLLRISEMNECEELLEQIETDLSDLENETTKKIDSLRGLLKELSQEIRNAIEDG